MINNKYLDNLLALYNQCPTSIKQQGRDWYDNARDYFLPFTNRYGLTEEQVFGVVSALSPFVSWSTQKVCFERFLITGKHPGFKGNLEKATKILAGVPPGFVVTGRKTYSFFKNLIGKHDHDYVTIDRHAVAAAGVPNENISNKVFMEIRNAYMESSQLVGEKVKDFQAIIWLQWKRLKVKNDRIYNSAIK